MIPKQYSTTEEIYFISPTDLSDMPYLEALELKLSGVKENKKIVADTWLRETLEGKDYKTISTINQTLDYLSKAESLVKLQILEVLSPSNTDFPLPRTITIYGVEPRKLALLTYKEALTVKLNGVIKVLESAGKILANMYNMSTTYEEISKFSSHVDYLTKAKKLTEFQLDEIKETV